MKIKELMISVLVLFSINLVSAFNGFDYINYIDPSFIVYGLLFLIFFAVLHFVLGRTMFRQNSATRAVISLCLAGICIYGLVKTEFDTGGIYSLGGTYLGDFFPTILTIALLIGFIILAVKFGLGLIMMVAGIALIALSFTDLIYEKTILFIIGALLFLFGLKFYQMRRRRRRLSGMTQWERRQYEESQKRKLQGWRNAGRKIGYSTAKGVNRTKGYMQNIQRKRQEIARANETKRKIQTQQTQQKIQRKQRQRTAGELQAKYNSYSDLIKGITRKYGGRIPPLNTGDGHQYHRCIQAMKAIENLARQQGIRLS